MMLFECLRCSKKLFALSVSCFCSALLTAPTSSMAQPASAASTIPTKTQATKTSKVAVPDTWSKSYMQEVSRSVKRHWSPPKRPLSNHAVVRFKIRKDGDIQDPQLTKSSGDPEVDRMAIEAVAQASPFPQLPAAAGESADIEFTFAYNVYGDADVSNVTRNFNTESSFESKLCLNLLLKARVLAEKHDLVSAIATIEQELRISPNDAMAKNLGSRYLSQSINSEMSNEMAVTKLHQAVVWDPNNKSAADKLNARLSKTGVDPTSFEKRSEYARSLARAGEYDAAIYEMKAALKVKDDETARTELASMYSDRIANARVKQWSLLLDRVSNAENHTGLGSALAMMGQFDKAKAEYDRALQIDPNYKMARDLLDELDKRSKKAEVEAKNP